MAAGSGTRFGRPKQFAELGGRPVVSWSVAAARSSCDGVVLVVPAAQVPPPGSSDSACFGADRVVAGGTSRSDSVRCGLAAVPEEAEIVVVHDAARPLAGPGLFEATIGALADPAVDGAFCAVPVPDTLKRVRPASGTAWPTVVETLDRGSLVAVQTPQAFRAAALRRAHEGGGEATDDAGLVEALGGVVVAVPGDPANVKLTAPGDLAYLEHLLAGRGG